ncbi:entericidin [Lacibacter sediminis]|uniref:Entericidin n=1 Tax=Lacibacter sediminis TaxID=2760713 RepID=A0A7G5XDV2_9BACT|nr:entericidin [Lacibacter sediminis]QNA43655.1 entericidin [Lacibacter sediminis]
MKKVLLAFAILGFVACNNEGEKTEATDTTTVAPADTTAPAAADTTAAAPADTTAAPAADTTKK